MNNNNDININNNTIIKGNLETINTIDKDKTIYNISLDIDNSFTYFINHFRSGPQGENTILLDANNKIVAFFDNKHSKCIFIASDSVYKGKNILELRGRFGQPLKPGKVYKTTINLFMPGWKNNDRAIIDNIKNKAFI